MRRLLVVVTAVAVAASLLTAVGPAPRAEAANAALWNPGYIISDAMFYDGAAMNAASIQEFLEQKVTSCTSGFTCLRDYRQNTPTMAPTALCPGGYAGAVNERASSIIAKVGAACNISQKALLVLLEKEQSLVTHKSPSSTRFARATGFSCPDTAPCDPAYAGFFYQVYHAARQFQNYAADPTRWNYQAGRVNNILYHPNAACGTAPVYIQNKATAGLYIYTPYQPNTAALGNLYGTGNGCSSYGNRNFWRIFSDWFGSPTVGSSLLRTTANATVYLVSGDNKYAIPSVAILSSLAPLGVVGYVSQSYLDGLTTRHNVGRSIRSPGGTIYFFDAGMKLPFTSCAQAADYGASCASDGYVQLTEGQISAFASGPALTSVVGTVEGARYFVDDGVKVEILDATAQSLAGIPSAMNVLTENAVAHLPLGSPIVRDGVFLRNRTSGTFSLLTEGNRYAIPAGSEAGLGVTTRATGSLWAASLATIPDGGVPFAGVVQAPDSSATTAVAATGRYEITGGGFAAEPLTVAQSLIDSYPVLGTIGPGSFIKSTTSAVVYIVMPENVRPVSSWGALLALTTDGNPVIIRMAPSLVQKFAVGPVALTAGTLARSPSNGTVYFINGVTSRVALSSFIFTTEAGFGPLVFASEERIQGYPLEPKRMTFAFSCGADLYVAAGGRLHLVAPELVPEYPFDPVPLDEFTCRRAKIGVPATDLIRTPNGAIFQLVDGVKRPAASMARLAEIAPGVAWLNVHPSFAAAIPTGPLA
jgi:hypothetical protein